MLDHLLAKARRAGQWPRWPEYDPRWPGLDEWQLVERGIAPVVYRRWTFLGYDSRGVAHYAPPPGWRIS